ncbi:MAG: polysaccharide deacetylase family protein [Nitrospiraceae bacterium]
MSLGLLKQALWSGIATAWHLSGAARARNRGQVAILTYHRVLSPAELRTEVVQPGMYVLADTFAMQMEFLRRHFLVLSFDDLLTRWADGRWDTRRPACVITFDDGWLDNLRHAAPVLKRLDLPATIFLPTDFIGTARWFWPEQLGVYLRTAGGHPESKRTAMYDALQAAMREAWPNAASRVFPHDISAAVADDVIDACKQLDHGRLVTMLDSLCARFAVTMPASRVTIDWDEVREMSRQGIAFGSHSCSHRLLDGLSADECRREAQASLATLRANGARVTPVFCYPNGNFNSTAQEAVRAAGYEAAVSCQPGLEGATPSDRFALRRVSLHQDISATPALYAMALAGLR